MVLTLPRVVFGVDEAEDAYRRLGANCGPGALAGLFSITPSQAVDFIPGFVDKGHTKETMMRLALDALGCSWDESLETWPRFGLVRILWDGPWWDEGMIARFMRSHWVASVQCPDGHYIFDINAINAGGWLSLEQWADECVPFILRDSKQATGKWSLWESFEVDPEFTVWSSQ